MNSSKITLTDLSDEILLKIFSELDTKSLVQVSGVTTLTLKIARDKLFWMDPKASKELREQENYDWYQHFCCREQRKQLGNFLYQAFLYAKAGSLENLKDLIEKEQIKPEALEKYFLDITDSHGNNLLSIARAYHQQAILDYCYQFLKQQKLLSKNALPHVPLVHLAVLCRKQEELTSLVNNDHCDINELGKNNQSVLHLISKSRAINFSSLIKLIELGANVNLTDDNGFAPLHYFAAKGNLECVKTLIANKADVNIKMVSRLPTLASIFFNTKSQQLGTALHVAAEQGHADVIRYLLENGADMTEEDGDENTAFQVAIRNGHADVVKVFIDHGVDIHMSGKLDITPMMLALMKNDYRTLGFLCIEELRLRKKEMYHQDLDMDQVVYKPWGFSSDKRNITVKQVYMAIDQLIFSISAILNGEHSGINLNSETDRVLRNIDYTKFAYTVYNKNIFPGYLKKLAEERLRKKP